VGLSFTEAGPPELFWLPGVPVSGVTSYSGFPESRSPELFIVVILGFPESRSPELFWLPGVPVSGVMASRSPGLRSYRSGFPESRSPELFWLPGVPVSGVIFPESRSPELWSPELHSRFPGVPVSGVRQKAPLQGLFVSEE